MSKRRSSEDPFERDPRDARRSRSGQSRERSASTSASNRQRSEEPRKRKRWPIFLAAILLIVLLLPNIIGWTGLHQPAINWALSDFQGTVKVKTASLGWFQGIHLSEVQANDLTGAPLATIKSVQTSKPLYAFLTGTNYGEIDIHEPAFHLKLRENGSNFEDAAANYMAMSQPSPIQNQNPDQSKTNPFDTLPKMTIRVHDGSATIATDATAQSWKIDSLAAAATVSSNESPLAATLQCRVMSAIPDASGQPAVSESGTVLLKSAFDTGSQQLSFSSANVELETQQFPLSIISPLAQRFIGASQITGNATVKTTALWNGTTNDIAANIQSAEIGNASIEAPAILGDDQFFLDRLNARGQIGLSPKRISARQFSVDTDFGRVDADGEFDPAKLADLSNGNQLLDSPLKMEGNLDIAKVIRRLPSTLRIHEDVNIESGTVQFSAATRNESGVRRLVVNLDTANIRATRSGQPIVWQQPLRIVGVLRESAGDFSLENFECVSDFLNISGEATLREGMFTATGDMNRLSQRIGQFADLSDMQFGGSLKGQFGWAVVGDQQVGVAQLVSQPIQIGGEFKVESPVLQMPGMPRWQPNQIVAKFSGAGKLNSNSNAATSSSSHSASTLRLNQAGIQLKISDEVATISLAQPVADAFSNQQWVFNTQVAGSIEGWLQHMRNFVDPGTFDATGQLNYAGITIFDSQQLRIEKGQYEIKQPSFVGYGVNAREDRVVGKVTANYQFNSGDISVQQATVQGSILSASAQDLRLAMSNTMLLDGSAAYRADINGVAQWLSLSPEPDSIHWYGTANGSVQFRSTASGTTARLNGDLVDVLAAQQAPAEVAGAQPTMQMVSNVNQTWVELWREPRINLVSEFEVGSDFDSIKFNKLAARSGSVDLDATGTLNDLSGSLTADLQGSWQPNYQKVNSLLAAYTSGMVAFEGNAVQPIRIKGPLLVGATESNAYVSDQLSVQTVIGWDRGQLLGLPIGKSEMNVDLSQQVASMNAAGIPLSGGVANLQPQLDMRSNKLVLYHGESRVLDNVQITPQVCEDCLKFVAPWLAQTTNAQGTFSADLMGVNMPIDDPAKVSARGSLAMKDVVFAAGPAAKQLLDTVSQIQAILKPESNKEVKTWLRVEQQTIPIAIDNGRVFHDGIKFSHKELEIRTSGSVGFDQTLNLVAKIPIVDEWIAGKSYLAGLKGQSLSIPITGTVMKPVVDQRALQNLSANLVKNAASNAIGNAVTEKLNPKIQRYQNEINNKVTGEVDKLQNKFQNKLGGFLNEKLRAPATPPANAAQPQGSLPQDAIEDKIGNEFKRGLDKLFGK